MERREHIEDKEFLIKQCRFYNNEEQAPRFDVPNGALLWDYERMWVESFCDKTYFPVQEYIHFLREGLSEFEKNDGTPDTLKAILFNRYGHWNMDDEEHNGFKKWYREEYLSRPRHIDEGNTNSFEDIQQRSKQIIQDYRRLEQGMIYFSTGGRTGMIPMRLTPAKIDKLDPNEIFVFGSNAQGHHMGGAARAAMDKFGAVWGQGDGLQGQSYAISTMEGLVATSRNVTNFIEFAEKHPELKFYVTPIGCGIAGYTPLQIAPLFRRAVVLENCYLPRIFWEYFWQAESTGPDFFEPDKDWEKWERQ